MASYGPLRWSSDARSLALQVNQVLEFSQIPIVPIHTFSRVFPALQVSRDASKSMYIHIYMDAIAICSPCSAPEVLLRHRKTSPTPTTKTRIIQ